MVKNFISNFQFLCFFFNDSGFVLVCRIVATTNSSTCRFANNDIFYDRYEVYVY